MSNLAPKILFAAALAFLVGGTSITAHAESCINSCVTMAIPRTDAGVITKLDGTADAVLWPPTQDLRKITIAAKNLGGSECDVTIRDVLQDEAPGRTSAGSPIDDAAECSNEGLASTIFLRSKRTNEGDGRSYHVQFELTDPDCTGVFRPDEVLVVVPRDDDAVAMRLQPYKDDGQLTASYSGPALECAPAKDDRLASAPGANENR
jgi:hypothetical protein